jgi:hypothetical protein
LELLCFQLRLYLMSGPPDIHQCTIAVSHYLADIGTERDLVQVGAAQAPTRFQPLLYMIKRGPLSVDPRQVKCNRTFRVKTIPESFSLFSAL